MDVDLLHQLMSRTLSIVCIEASLLFLRHGRVTRVHEHWGYVWPWSKPQKLGFMHELSTTTTPSRLSPSSPDDSANSTLEHLLLQSFLEEQRSRNTSLKIEQPIQTSTIYSVSI
jgi:hypothetical protein